LPDDQKGREEREGGKGEVMIEQENILRSSCHHIFTCAMDTLIKKAVATHEHSTSIYKYSSISVNGHRPEDQLQIVHSTKWLGAELIYSYYINMMLAHSILS
jgi:hypothetical protein